MAFMIINPIMGVIIFAMFWRNDKTTYSTQLIGLTK